MNFGAKLVVAIFVVAGGAAQAETMTTVKCNGVSVIMSEEQVAKVKTATGEADFGPKVCAVAEAVDASGYVEPTAVSVIMPDGESYDIKLQAAQ